MSYDNTNRGALWKNEDRTKENNWPHFKGSMNVDGVEYWLSAYYNGKQEAGSKRPTFSLSVKPKNGQASKPKPSPAQDADPYDDGDLPF